MATPGVHAIGQQASAAFAYVNSVCSANNLLDFQSGSGSLTITTVSSTDVTGSFDITFGSTSSGGQTLEGGHLTGSFDAPTCPGG